MSEPIAESLKKCPHDLRLVHENKWITWDNIHEVWAVFEIVYTLIHHGSTVKAKNRVVMTTPDIVEALAKLLE